MGARHKQGVWGYEKQSLGKKGFIGIDERHSRRDKSQIGQLKSYIIHGIFKKRWGPGNNTYVRLFILEVCSVFKEIRAAYCDKGGYDTNFLWKKSNGTRKYKYYFPTNASVMFRNLI